MAPGNSLIFVFERRATSRHKDNYVKIKVIACLFCATRWRVLEMGLKFTMIPQTVGAVFVSVPSRASRDACYLRHVGCHTRSVSESFQLLETDQMSLFKLNMPVLITRVLIRNLYTICIWFYLDPHR